MVAALYPIAEGLDWLRARTLRGTLSLPGIGEIFKSRAARLSFLFAVATSLSLSLSLIFPLYVLLIGPIIYGFPHLFASFRYVDLHLSHAQSRPGMGLRFFSLIFVIISFWRLAVDLKFVSLPLQAPHLPELVSLALSFVACAFVYRRKIFPAVLVLALVLMLAWWAPLAFIGAFLLLHNLIAFFYWIASARSKAERRVSWIATLTFIGISVLILRGQFDFVYKLWAPMDSLKFAQLDYFQVGKMIFPWSENPMLWFYATIAYSFGQSLHYFVWLKAIPDQRNQSEIPTSFRQSLRLAVDYFGRRYFAVLVIALLVGLGVWSLVAMPLARTIYFAVSAYHGYLELASLGFGSVNKSAP